MFQEVSGTVGLVRFRPTPSIDPYTNSRRLSPWRVLCRDLKDTCQCIYLRLNAIALTVNPFDRVVLSVFTP
jgi:hypothetical protein